MGEIERAALRHAGQGSGNGGPQYDSIYQYVLRKPTETADFDPEPLQRRWRDMSGRHLNDRESYIALGGMGDIESQATVKILRADQSMGGAVKRRTSSDPLSGVVRRGGRPQSEYSRAMACIGEVAHGIGIQHRDYKEEDSPYVRVCSLVKIPHGLLRADGHDQSVAGGMFRHMLS